MKLGKGLVKMLGLHELFEALKNYLEARLDLLKTELKEEALNIVVKLIVVVVLLFFFFLFIIFGSIALGSFLNHVLGSIFYGYLIVTGFYFLLLLLVILFRSTRIFTRFLEGLKNKILR